MPGSPSSSPVQAAAHKDACIGRSPNLDSSDYLVRVRA